MNVTTTLRWFAALGLALAVGSVPAHNPPRTDLQRPESFLREVFGEQVPESETIWMAGDVVPRVRAILGHKPLQLRIPYWRRGGRTAWVLEESVEGAPVTAGVVMEGTRIAQVRILVYGARHGRDVTTPGFLNQFKGASLNGPHQTLDRVIRDDAGVGHPAELIIGLARLVLYLNEQTLSAADAQPGWSP
ncbi:MAG: hypothetical protein ACOY5W_01950 [Pseudomonadota bacterium]